MDILLNEEEFSIAFPQNIYYSTTTPLHVTDVIKSLHGLNTLVKSSKRTLNALFDSNISDVELYIKTIEEGSLREETFVKLFFGSKEKYDQFIENIHNKVGDKTMKTVGAVILAVISGLILYGLYKAAFAHSENGTITSQSYNTINNYYISADLWEKGAENVNLTADKFKKTVETSITNKKEIAQGAINIMHPTKDDSNAELFIETNNKQTLIAPKDVVQATPHGKIDFSSIEDVVEYNDIDIQIRALDLDNSKKGWAGIIPNVIDYRVKIEVADGVDTSKLLINKTIRADVFVELKKDSSTGQLKATKIFLDKLY